MPLLIQDAVETVESFSPPQVTARASRTEKKPRSIGRRYATQVFLTSAPLVLADLLALVGSCLLASQMIELLWSSSAPHIFFRLVFLSGSLFVINSLYGLYPATGLNPIVELRWTSIAVTLLFAFLFVASIMNNSDRIYPQWLVASFLAAIILIPLLRFLARTFCSRFGWWGQPVLIFSGREAGESIQRHFEANPRLGLRPIGVIDDLRSIWDGTGVRPNYPYFGPSQNGKSRVQDNGIFWAIVVMPKHLDSQMRQAIEKRVGNFPHVVVVPDMTGLPSLGNHTFDCAGRLGIQITTSLLLPVPYAIKRAMDLSLVIFGGLVCLPLIGLIALLIKINSPGPIIYGSVRIGFKGRRFRAWKFRTMVIDADKALERYLATHPEKREEWEKNFKLSDDPRITRLGRWLRCTSLDELPQLWNVLVGEMSLVGPRPMLKAEIINYGEGFDLYTRVVPGITGPWQISGRNNLSYPERIRLNSNYVRNWSPWLDLYILARTVNVVLRRDGAR